MSKEKGCPLAFGTEDERCSMDACQWWHGEVCDMSRIAAQMTVVPAFMQRLAGDTNASELENAVMRTSEVFAGKEVPE